MKPIRSYINIPTFNNSVRFFRNEIKMDYYHVQEVAFYALEKGASFIGYRDQKMYFRARKKESSKRIEEIWNKKKYGDRILFTTRNIADREVLKSQKDLERSKEVLNSLRNLQMEHKETQDLRERHLKNIEHQISENAEEAKSKLKELKENLKVNVMDIADQTLLYQINELQKQISKIEISDIRDKVLADQQAYKELFQKIRQAEQSPFEKVTLEDDPEHCLSDGICFGICEFASREFLKETDTAKIEASLKEKPAEAAANQAVYQLIKRSKSPDQYLLEVVNQLKDSGEFEDIDLDGVLYALAMRLKAAAGVDEAHKKKRRFTNAINILLEQNPYETDKDRAIPNRFLSFYVPELYEDPEIKLREKALFDALFQYSEGIKNYMEMKPSEPVLEKTGFWNKLYQHAEKLFGYSKTQKTKTKPPLLEAAFNSISDKKMQYQFKESLQFCELVDRGNLISSLNGYHHKALLDKFGLPGSFSNDDKFFEKYDDLEEGTYLLLLATKKSRHVILIKKEPFQKVYILDPNIGMFECSRDNPPLETLKEIVNGYSSPPNEHPDAQPGEVNHKLRLVKVEKSN